MVCFSLFTLYAGNDDQNIRDGAIDVTRPLYSETDNLAQKVQAEFGNESRIADWKDLAGFQGQLGLLFDKLGIKDGEVLLVTNNGNRYYSGSRHYILVRGTPHAGAAVHARYGNEAWLGSWYGYKNVRILAYVESPKLVESSIDIFRRYLDQTLGYTEAAKAVVEDEVYGEMIQKIVGEDKKLKGAIESGRYAIILSANTRKTEYGDLYIYWLKNMQPGNEGMLRLPVLYTADGTIEKDAAKQMQAVTSYYQTQVEETLVRRKPHYAQIQALMTKQQNVLHAYNAMYFTQELVKVAGRFKTGGLNTVKTVDTILKEVFELGKLAYVSLVFRESYLGLQEAYDKVGAYDGTGFEGEGGLYDMYRISQRIEEMQDNHLRASAQVRDVMGDESAWAVAKEIGGNIATVLSLDKVAEGASWEDLYEMADDAANLSNMALDIVRGYNSNYEETGDIAEAVTRTMPLVLYHAGYQVVRTMHKDAKALGQKSKEAQLELIKAALSSGKGLVDVVDVLLEGRGVLDEVSGKQAYREYTLVKMLLEQLEENQQVSPSNSVDMGSLYTSISGSATILTVTFDSQGGDSPSFAAKQVGQNQMYGELPTVARNGYVFDGWWTEKNGEGTQVFADTRAPIMRTHTLYAKWSETSFPFILVVETGSAFNLEKIVADQTRFPGARLGDGYVYWEDVRYMDNYLDDPNHPRNFGYAGRSGFQSGDPGIVHKIYSNGRIEAYLNTYDQLLSLGIFVERYGFSNTYDFSKSQGVAGLGPLKDFITDDDFVRQNLLGVSVYTLYQKLFKQNSITAGKHLTSKTLYEVPWKLYNNTGRRVTIIRSMIYNVSSGWLYQNETNGKWSPIAKNPRRSVNLARSFDLSYEDVQEGSIYIHTFTDNGMNGRVKLLGMSSNVKNHSKSSGPYRIAYDAKQNTYEVYNSNYGAAGLMLFNEFPSRVELSCRYTWSLVYQMFLMAVYDGEIITANHKEGPSPGDDGNPLPFKGYIEPGLNE